MWSQLVLLTKCYQSDKILEDEAVVACTPHERSEELSQNLVGQPEGKWPLGRFWCKLRNMKINLKEAGNEGDRSIILAQGRNECRVFVTKEIKQTSVYV
jgi:hypothetical protein